MRDGLGLATRHANQTKPAEQAPKGDGEQGNLTP